MKETELDALCGKMGKLMEVLHKRNAVALLCLVDRDDKNVLQISTPGTYADIAKMLTIAMYKSEGLRQTIELALQGCKYMELKELEKVDFS